MKAGVIVVVVASAFAVVACTNSETWSKQDRTAGTGSTATTGAAMPSADNTGINQRDRQEATTPVDQGNSTAETNITASIRKGIMADEKLSFNGKNVKVITVGTKVTLRGPVESEQARTAIAELATRTPGVSEVDNQLEVVKSKTSAK